MYFSRARTKRFPARAAPSSAVNRKAALALSVHESALGVEKLSTGLEGNNILLIYAPLQILENRLSPSAKANPSFAKLLRIYYVPVCFSLVVLCAQQHSVLESLTLLDIHYN